MDRVFHLTDQLVWQTDRADRHTDPTHWPMTNLSIGWRIGPSSRMIVPNDSSGQIGQTNHPTDFTVPLTHWSTWPNGCSEWLVWPYRLVWYTGQTNCQSNDQFIQPTDHLVRSTDWLVKLITGQIGLTNWSWLMDWLDQLVWPNPLLWMTVWLTIWSYHLFWLTH